MNDLEDASIATSALRRRAQFVAADRHSKRVSRLKIAFGGLCLALIAGLVWLGAFKPFDRLPKGVSATGAALNGSKITMEHPKLSGFRRDGRPYQLLASSGVQDLRTPKIVELNDIDAALTMADQTVLKLRAPHGVYDTVADRMQVSSEIEVTDSSRYQARLRSADLDFKAGSIVSNDPVTVLTANSTVSANSIEITENGDNIVFEGDVRSTISSAQDQSEKSP